MSISKLGSVGPLKPVQSDKVKGSDPSSKDVTAGFSDALSVSRSESSEVAGKARKAIESAPDMRLDRISEVQARMSSDDYLEKAIDKTAEAILGQFLGD